MKKSEIIYDIREKFKINSDDVNITNEYLSHLIDVKRALLVKQRYSKLSKTIPASLKQTICLTLDVATVPGTCFNHILKTVETIPDFIESYERDSLLDIRFHDMTIPPINIVSFDRMPYLGYSKWIKNQVYGAYKENSLYLFSKNPKFKLLKNIVAEGIFTNPEEAYNMSCESSSNSCDYIDTIYNVPSSMISDIVNMVMKDLSVTVKLQEDKLNNSDESPR